MQLTRHTDYALRVLIFLGHQPERLATIAEIAEAYAISKNHLMKVVHQLGKAGFIHTTRGKQGGLRLGRPASEINVGDVVRATEGNLQLVNCTDPGCVILSSCVLQGIVAEALNAFLASLDRYTLHDLVSQRHTQLSRLLGT